MHTRIHVLLIGVTVWLAGLPMVLGGCAPPTLEPRPTPTPFDLTSLPEDAPALPWETIEATSWGGYRQDSPALLVISTADEIAHTVPVVGQETKAELDNLDFGTAFALIAFQGLKSSTGHKIEVRALVRQADEIAVYAYFVSPRPGEPVGASETSPYHAIKVLKEGNWADEFTFILYDNDRPVAETKHFIP